MDYYLNAIRGLRKNCEIDYTITKCKARGRAYSKGGGNVTVLAFYIT
jgi:hypothetical protein